MVIRAATLSGRTVEYVDISRDDPRDLVELILDGLVKLNLKRMYLSRSWASTPALYELVVLCEAHAAATSRASQREIKLQLRELLRDTGVCLSYCASGHLRTAVRLNDAIAETLSKMLKGGGKRVLGGRQGSVIEAARDDMAGARDQTSGDNQAGFQDQTGGDDETHRDDKAGVQDQAGPKGRGAPDHDCGPAKIVLSSVLLDFSVSLR